MAADSIIGAMRIILGMDTASFDDGVKKTESKLAAFGKSLGITMAAATAAVGAAAVGLGVALKKSIDHADQLGKAAQKIGIPVEELSKLQHAADLSDVSLEQLSTSVIRLSKNMGEIAGGKTTTAAADAFAALNLNIRNVDGSLKNTDQVISEVAGKFAGFADGVNKTALAVAIFGKSGAELIPLLNQGADGLAKAKKEAEDLGLVISTKTAKAAEEFNDNMKTLSKASNVLFIELAALTAGPLATFTRMIIDARIEGTKTNSVWESSKTILATLFPVTALVLRQLRDSTEDLSTSSMAAAAGIREIGKGLQVVVNKKPDAPTIIDRDKLAKDLKAFEDAKTKLTEHFTALEEEGRAIMERLATPTEALAIEIGKIDAAFLKGALSVEMWGLAHQRVMEKAREQQAETAASAAGNFAKAFEFAAQSNKKFAVAFKAASIAEAIISTYVGANKALAASPPPLNFIAAAAVVAAGLANVAKIASTNFQTGGSFKVGGFGGIDSQMVAIRATPGEMVNVRRPDSSSGGMSTEITMRGIAPGDFFTGDMLRETVNALNRAHSDGYVLKFGET